VQRYWSRFAYSGDPNGAGDSYWPTYDGDEDAYLALRHQPIADAGLARASCSFWRDYFLQGGTILLD
jgi:carboxylesterase type B